MNLMKMKYIVVVRDGRNLLRPCPVAVIYVEICDVIPENQYMCIVL
jgi:hypothetical protein